MTAPAPDQPASSGSHRFLIWGAGGHGAVVAEVTLRLGHTVAGYIDADPARVSQQPGPAGLQVVADQARLERLLAEGGPLPGEATAIALGVGSAAVRRRMWSKARGRAMPAVAHPSAVISASATVGEATVVAPRAVVNARAVVGVGVIINTGAIIEHDCTVDDFAHVAPGAILLGGVAVGVESWIGAGAVVLPGLTIGTGATVGAGAVVVKDVEPGAVVVGVPARPLQR